MQLLTWSLQKVTFDSLQWGTAPWARAQNLQLGDPRSLWLLFIASFPKWFKTNTDQIDIYKEILSNKLSVRATEILVKNYHNPKSVKPTKQTELPEFIQNGVQEIASYFGHKIDIKMEKNGSGKIQIPFHSKEDYDRILKLFKSDK